MEDIKISIVTPSFNQGIYIEDAIKSVLKQDYKNFEHIIIDNLSTDNTIEVLKRYKHLKWVSEKDGGQSDAINKGFNKCTGEIIGWLNADDHYTKNTFKHIKSKLINPEIDAVYGNYFFINKNNQITKKMIVSKPSKFLSKFICFIPSTTFFFKRKIIENNIFIDKDFYITMDKEFFANIFHRNYNIHKIDKFLAKFRWHDTNKSIDTFKIKKIRYEEGLIIYNRYSKIKLPKNIFGIFFYVLIQKITLIYNMVSKKYL
jgi:glycosyltransferase involved in cell wall biosynthesis